MISSATFYLSTLQMTDIQYASNSFPWLTTLLQWTTLHTSPYGASRMTANPHNLTSRENHIPINTWHFQILIIASAIDKATSYCYSNFLYLLMIKNIFIHLLALEASSSVKWVFISMQLFSIFYFVFSLLISRSSPFGLDVKPQSSLAIQNIYSYPIICILTSIMFPLNKQKNKILM